MRLPKPVKQRLARLKTKTGVTIQAAVLQCIEAHLPKLDGKRK